MSEIWFFSSLFSHSLFTSLHTPGLSRPPFHSHQIPSFLTPSLSPRCLYIYPRSSICLCLSSETLPWLRPSPPAPPSIPAPRLIRHDLHIPGVKCISSLSVIGFLGCSACVHFISLYECVGVCVLRLYVCFLCGCMCDALLLYLLITQAVFLLHDDPI